LAWITGGGSGIGRALALLLAGAGWRVAVSGRRSEALQEVVDAGAPNRILALPLDVTDRSAIAAGLQRLTTEQGPIDLAVLNAGDYRPMPLRDYDPGLFEYLMEVNFMGPVNCIAALLPWMRQSRHGQILINASLAGYCGLPKGAPYGASKAALINMAEALAPELARQGIRLRLINPGFIRTRLTERNSFPMPFLADPEEMAEAIARQLNGDRFEILYPRRLALLMKLLRMLPYKLFFAVTGRMA